MRFGDGKEDEQDAAGLLHHRQVVGGYAEC
jgi:hypothetical protein